VAAVLLITHTVDVPQALVIIDLRNAQFAFEVIVRHRWVVRCLLFVRIIFLNEIPRERFQDFS